jgi:hypothetical protein
MALSFKGDRKYPSIPTVLDNIENHSEVLRAIKEALEIGQRRTNDFRSSYVRVGELIDLGLIDLSGNLIITVGTTSAESSGGGYPPQLAHSGI